MPPWRKSKLMVVVENPTGPHHCARCLGSVHAEKTNWRGASNSRVPMIDRASLSRSRLLFTLMLYFPGLRIAGLQLFQIIVETIETAFEEAAIALEPIIQLFEGARLNPARPPLRFA